MSYSYFIGIDVGKDFFDLACHGAATKPRRFKNNRTGFAALWKALGSDLPQALVVVEATSGYEDDLLAFLHAKGVALHRLQPLKAAQYRKSLHGYAKTDAMDAVALARYGAERHKSVALYTPPDQEQSHLNALYQRRADLMAMYVAERQRLSHPRYRGMAQEIGRVCAVLKEALRAVEAELRRVVQESARLSARYTALRSVKGVGEITALCLIALMPELGRITKGQAAALAGVAPHPQDSGKHQGYRATRGGRRSVRKVLYMAAMTATWSNPKLKAFYQHLKDNGKKPLVALTAVMRKLIVTLNAILKSCPQQTW